MKRICVFAGSGSGNDPQYEQMAERLGEEMVAKGIDLVYGGSTTGLMGKIADTVLRGGGRVSGVMPRGLSNGEIVHKGLTELHEVDTMHERKALMSSLADGYIALPGGYGTFEELFEVVCWSQIGIHSKPIGLLNVSGFYDPLMGMVVHAAKAGFIPERNTELLILDENPAQLIERMQNFVRPSNQKKWKQRD